MIIKTYSGDLYEIPKGQEFEWELYKKAIENDDPMEMLKYESGDTGWLYRGDLD